MAQSVIDADDPIDELYLNIDHSVLELLALQSPVAADLRLVSAILHSCLHLERIGDQAVNVAKLHLVTKTEPGSATMRQQIAEMGGIVVDMVRTAMEAFARRDLALCMKLPFMDDPVDRLNRATHLEALKLADDPRSLGLGLAHEHGRPSVGARRGQRGRHRGAGRVPDHRRVPRVHRRLPPGGRLRPVADVADRILIVEDEESLADSIRYNLEREGYIVTVAPTVVARWNGSGPNRPRS